MPQEFQVLRCFSCQTFQVHQVKKAKKWNCKVCGEKQSILKVFGRGSGLECRGHTQKLNRLQGEVNDSVDLRTANEHDDQGDPRSTKCKQDGPGSPTIKHEINANGRWSQYIDETNSEDPEEKQNELSTDFSTYTTDWNQYKTESKSARVNRLSGSRNAKRKSFCESESEQSNLPGSFGQTKYNKMSRMSSPKGDVRPGYSRSSFPHKTYPNEIKNKDGVKFGGSGGMDSDNFGNLPEFKSKRYANFERVPCGTYYTSSDKNTKFVPKFLKKSNASYSSEELDNSRDNKGTKSSKYENDISKSPLSIDKSDYCNAASYQEFAGKSSHDLETDLSNCYGTENLRNIGVRSGMLKQIGNTEASDDCTYYQRSTPTSVVNDGSGNMIMNSNQLTTDMSTRTRDPNVNKGSPCTGFMLKKSTNQQNSARKSTAANVNSSSKWGKFLSSAQESSDEFSQEVEFEQQNLNGKNCLQDKVNITSNSYIPFPASVSSVKNCYQNTVMPDSEKNIDHATVFSNCSSLVTKCNDSFGKIVPKPDVINLFSLDGSDEENILNFDL